ncbi:MAG TPA: class I SAM-dependent methyltransferase [Candidatus Saccharimonadales bacterium]|jgi:SAM-dependent methyltransferase
MAASTPTKTPQQLKATPEVEDFAHKYTEEGQGKIGRRLLDGYFNNVAQLVKISAISRRDTAAAIEIGCGEGFSTKRLNDLLPAQVTLEASEYVAHMIPKAQANNPGMRVTEESVYDLQHADNSFDLVFLLEVLEHLDFPDKGLAELQRITKPGGFIVLGVPREPLWCALNMARGKYLKRFGNTPGHLNHWSTNGIKKYVEQHFGPVQVVKTPLPWTLLLAKKPE